MNCNNELHFYSAFPSAQSALQWFIHSYIGRWSGEQSTPASSLPTFTHQWWQADTDRLIGGNVGFSVLPKDTLTCGQEEPGFEPPTHGSLDDLLCLLIHSHPDTQYSALQWKDVGFSRSASQFMVTIIIGGQSAEVLQWVRRIVAWLNKIIINAFSICL